MSSSQLNPIDCHIFQRGGPTTNRNNSLSTPHSPRHIPRKASIVTRDRAARGAGEATARGLLRRPGEGHGHGKVEGRQPNI